MTALFVILVALFLGTAIIGFCGRNSRTTHTSASPSSVSTPTFEKERYTTTLQIRSPLPSDVVGCKDGVVYVGAPGSYLGRAIGLYRQDFSGDWMVYSSEQYEIGRVHKSPDGDYHIYLTLFEIVSKSPHLRSRVINSRKEWLWCAAEAIPSTEGLIDHDTCESLGFYRGNPIEAGAAFICWAYTSSRNRFSDYFDL